MPNKEVVQAVYKEFFNDHDIDSVKKYIREDYVQHNPGVTQGRQGLMDAFRQKFIDEPSFRLEIKMMIAEDDMVAVYLKNVDPVGNTKCRVVDIYRLKDGKLAEHWDVLQPVISNSMP